MSEITEKFEDECLDNWAMIWKGLIHLYTGNRKDMWDRTQAAMSAAARQSSDLGCWLTKCLKMLQISDLGTAAFEDSIPNIIEEMLYAAKKIEDGEYWQIQFFLRNRALIQAQARQYWEGFKAEMKARKTNKN